MKSDIEILKWVRHKILGSELKNEVSGELSDRGRPYGSESEDIVISVLANDGCGQIQSAYVNVNIYVSDLWNAERNAWERDTVRVNALCELSKFLFKMNDDGYRVSDKNSAQNVMKSEGVFQDGHTEHFINNKLFIKISNE